MKTDIIQSLIKEIDKVAFLLLKADKWQILAARLQKQLLTKTDAVQREHIRDAIDEVTRLGDSLTDEKIASIINNLQNDLGVAVTEEVASVITKTQLIAYKQSYADLSLKFEFNEPNQKALAWLEEDQMYWVKNRYDDELRQRLLDGAKDVIQEGQSLEQQGKNFGALLSDTYKGNKSYWEGLSNHIVTRSREFARVDGYNEAGITKVEIHAVMDSRTSEICKALNGKIIEVSVLSKQRDALMKAKDPEAVKEIAPFWSDKMTAESFGPLEKAYVDFKNKIKKAIGMEIKKDDLPKGIGMPPYHYNCRTITLPVIE